MWRSTRTQADMDRRPGGLRERPDEVLDQSGVEGPDHLGGNVDLVDHEGPPGQVQRDLDGGLVQGNGDRGEPAHPFLLPESLRERLAKSDADVLYRVVSVDLQVPFARDV